MADTTQNHGSTGDAQPKLPVLDYAPARKPAALLDAARILGMALCAVTAVVGLVAVCFGVHGLWYAATETPAVGKGAIFFQAGMVTVIGLLMSVFPLRWFWHGVVARRKSRV